MIGNKQVRFIKSWQFYNRGDLIWPVGTLRDWLMGAGYVELVEEDKADEPAATVTANEETVNKKKKRKQRKRQVVSHL